MSDLYSSNLGLNSVKSSPSSMFGTRDLVFYYLGAAENFWDNGNYSDPDSRYAAAVRGIQQYAELFFLGPPNENNTDSFVFAIASNTVNHEYDEQGNDYPEEDPNEDRIPSSLGQGIYEALGHNNFDVRQIRGHGDIIDDNF